MQKSDTYAPQIQAMITTTPGEFSYCYAADTVHAIATCDAPPSKAPDTPEVWPTSWGVRRLRYGGYLFSQNASVYHTYRCAKPDIQDPGGVAHCERPTETDDTPEVESPDTP
jgi:hypothetical protein